MTIRIKLNEYANANVVEFYSTDSFPFHTKTLYEDATDYLEYIKMFYLCCGISVVTEGVPLAH